MDKNQIFILAAALVAVAIRLYMKYIKKGKEQTGSDIKKSSTSFPSSSKEDDYEPYLKK